MAEKLMTYKKIKTIRSDLKSLCTQLQKVVNNLPTNTYQTKGSAKLNTYGYAISTTFNSAENNLTTAHRAANALGSVKQIPKATKLPFSISKYSASKGIKVKTEEALADANTIDKYIVSLGGLKDQIERCYKEIDSLNATEQFINSLTVVDYLFPLGSLGKLALVNTVKNIGTTNLKQAKDDVKKLIRYFQDLKKALTTSVNQFAVCEKNVKSKTYEDALATTSTITENSNTPNNEVKNKITELEQKQKDYVYLYGEECPEIAEEIARLKELLIVECDVPLYGQKTNYTCGSASGSMILNSLGINVSEESFWRYANAGGEGTYVYRITQTLNHFLGAQIYSYVQTNKMGLEEYAKMIETSLERGYPVQMVIRIPRGTAFGYSSNGHYVVVTGIYQDKNGEYMVKINDPFSKSGPNAPQQIEMKLSELKQYNANHSGYVICNR